MSLGKATELRQGYRQARLSQSQPQMLADSSISSETLTTTATAYRLLQDAKDS
jgi:hypothetical protein